MRGELPRPEMRHQAGDIASYFLRCSSTRRWRSRSSRWTKLARGRLLRLLAPSSLWRRSFRKDASSNRYYGTATQGVCNGCTLGSGSSVHPSGDAHWAGTT